jgi:hypothetical protein
MVGASRCIVATLFKFGGPETLPQAARLLCVLTADLGFLPRVPITSKARNFSAQHLIRAIRNRSRAKNEKGFLCLRGVAEGVWAHVQGREATAKFAAVA